jgi:acetoacetyl-CoA synthetase
MPGPLWTPSSDRIARANVMRFGQGRSYAELYEWSVTKPLEFWDAMWDFGGIIGTKGGRVAVDMDRMPGARFFPNATLNFAENALRRGGPEPAIIFKSEDGTRRTMSWSELRGESAAFAAALRAAGIGPGDRVVGYLTNAPEAIVAMLA